MWWMLMLLLLGGGGAHEAEATAEQTGHSIDARVTAGKSPSVPGHPTTLTSPHPLDGCRISDLEVREAGLRAPSRQGATALPQPFVLNQSHEDAFCVPPSLCPCAYLLLRVFFALSRLPRCPRRLICLIQCRMRAGARRPVACGFILATAVSPEV